MVSKNIYASNNISYLIIVSLLIIVLLYFIYKHLSTKTIEGFEPTVSGDNFSGLDANPLIDRIDGSTIIASPSGSLSNSSDIILGSTVSGWKPADTSIKSSSVIVNLLALKKIKYIVVRGIKAFRVFFSSNQNDAFSYEEVLYQTKNNIPRDNPTLFYEISDASVDSNTFFGNLTTADGKPIFAKYIKIVPVNFSDFTTEEKTQRTGSPFGTKGMKLEIFGYPNDAKPDSTGESVTFKMYDELGSENDPRIKITLTEPKQINSIVFSNQPNTKFVAEFSIVYKLSDTDMSNTVNNIKGNSSDTSKSTYSYYFNTPIIASELIIKPTKTSGSSGKLTMYIDNIKGFSVNKKQITALTEKTKKQYCSSKEESGEAGSVSELLNQQSEIQQLCDALELQDQIKENNQRIQKNKQYLAELEEQDKKIVELEGIVEKMKHIRAIREKNNDHKMVDQELKQNKIETQLSQLVEDRKRNMKQLNLNLKFNTNPATTPTPPLNLNEGFTNYSSSNSNSGNLGFYYRPYDDTTVKTQLIESSEEYSPDLRLFNQNKKNIGYQFEKASPMNFYENKVMQCTSGCDTNAKFIARL